MTINTRGNNLKILIIQGLKEPFYRILFAKLCFKLKILN